MRKVLVTGGAGFIGSHVVDLLLQQKNHVVILDDFSTGAYENLPLDNENLRIIKGTIVNSGHVSEAMSGCDSIIHLAAIASVQASMDDPLATHQVNFDGTLNLLAEAKKQGVMRFIFASSAAVYGDATKGAISEKATISPITPYAFDKLASEYYLQYFAQSFGIQYTAFRFFNIYGPRQNPSSPYSGVISIFTEQAKLGNSLKIFGDGKQSRDFVFVKDLVKILANALDSIAMQNKIINIGRGQNVTLLGIVNALESILSKPIDIEFLASRSGDIKNSLADISLLNLLAPQLVPSTHFADGLKETLNV